MEVDAFSDPGAAGRITPVGMPLSTLQIAAGAFAFCLGHDTPGAFALLTPGDYVEVEQTGLIPSGTDHLIFRARTRAPATTPPGFSWVASVQINGVESGQRTLALSGPIDWSVLYRNWTVDLSQVSTSTDIPASIAFRLTLLGPALPPETPVLELEVPAFYVDQLAFFWAYPLQVFNEVPAAGQGQIFSDTVSGLLQESPAPPQSTSVEFDVFGLDDSTWVSVNIAGTIAVLRGVTQPGFSCVFDLRGTVMHTTVTPLAGFSSMQHVEVFISIAADGPDMARWSFGYNQGAWSFDVADTTAPLIATVQALSPTRLRVTWNATVQMVDPAAPHDSLNPALYSLAAMQPDAITPCVRGSLDPAQLPRVVSVEPVQHGDEGIASGRGPIPTVVDLVTDVEITPGVPYAITETGVATPVGTLFFGGDGAPVYRQSSGAFTTCTAVASGFVLPWPEGRVFDLMRLLPRMNRVEDTTRDLVRFVRCLQEPANLLLYDVDNWTDVLDVDRAPEWMLDAMLEDLGNPFPFVLTVPQKRQLVRLLVPLYGQAGTGLGIVNAVRFFLGIEVTTTAFTGGTMELGISELGGDPISGIPGMFSRGDPALLGSWVLGPGSSYALYCFRIVSPVPLTAAQIEQITIIANLLKPGHTHLIEIVVPHAPEIYDPVELGMSELGWDWLLHL